MAANREIATEIHGYYLSHDRALDILQTARQPDGHWPYNGIGLRGSLGVAVTKFRNGLWLATPRYGTTLVVDAIDIAATGDGQHWAHVKSYECLVNRAPALTPFRNHLYCAYSKARPNNVNLGVHVLTIDGHEFGPERLAAPGAAEFCLARVRDTSLPRDYLVLLVIGYLGNSADIQILAYVSTDGAHWPAPQDITDQIMSGLPHRADKIRSCPVDQHTALVSFRTPDARIYAATIQIADGQVAASPPLHLSTTVRTDQAPAIAFPGDRTWLFFSAAESQRSLVTFDYGGGGHGDLRRVGTQAAHGDPAALAVTYEHGSVVPSFLILSLMYAPPGSKGAHAGVSNVTYHSGSTAGAEHSITGSIGAGASASITAGDPDVSSASTGWNISASLEAGESVSITKTKGTKIEVHGPSDADGIDHEYDLFYLWTNPKIRITQDSYGNISWAAEPHLDSLDGQPVVKTDYYTVKTIRRIIFLLQETAQGRASAAQKTELQTLNCHGYSLNEWEAVLLVNPFLQDKRPRYPRFIHAEPSTVPYKYGSGEGVSETNSVSISVTSQSHVTAAASVGYSVSASGREGLASADLSAELSLSLSASVTTTDSTVQTASYTINPPSVSYHRTDPLFVYWDRIFRTFVFSYEPELHNWVAQDGAVDD